jgi:hypothetical protein
MYEFMDSICDKTKIGRNSNIVVNVLPRRYHTGDRNWPGSGCELQMKGPAHGALAAGLSSACVTGYTRHHTHKAYDSDVDSPPKKELISDRIPLAFAGLGFTGLSTAVAYGFDTMEKYVLGDWSSDTPLNQQMGVHRSGHTVLHVMGIGTAAGLVLHASRNFGEWIASKLQVQNLAPQITDHLEGLAEWILSLGSITGGISHLLTDLPTMGHGGTALRLLAPITNHNFALQLFKSGATWANRWFTLAGITLAGLSWVGSAAYLVSWKPPETHVRDYAKKLNECDNPTDVIETIQLDLSQSIEQLTGDIEEFWNRPLFESRFEELSPNLEHHWFHQHIDSEKVFGVDSYNLAELDEQGILTEDAYSLVSGTTIQSPESIDRPSIKGRPLNDIKNISFSDVFSENDEGLPLSRNNVQESVTLFGELNRQDSPISEDEKRIGSSLFTDDSKETESRLFSDKMESGESIFSEADREQSGISINEDSDTE